MDLVNEIIKIMNAYTPEDINNFCLFWLGSPCSNINENIEDNDVTKWPFYNMLLRQWPTEDFGTIIDYFQRYLYLFHSDATEKCGDTADELRKDNTPPSMRIRAVRVRK